MRTTLRKPGEVEKGGSSPHGSSTSEQTLFMQKHLLIPGRRGGWLSYTHTAQLAASSHDDLHVRLHI